MRREIPAETPTAHPPTWNAGTCQQLQPLGSCLDSPEQTRLKQAVVASSKCGRYGTWNCGSRKLRTRQGYTSMLLARLPGGPRVIYGVSGRWEWRRLLGPSTRAQHHRHPGPPCAAAASHHNQSSSSDSRSRHDSRLHATRNPSETEPPSASLPHPTASSWTSELVTRTVLQATATALACGISPQGVSDLFTPPSDPSPEVGDLDGPTCHRCTIRRLPGPTAEVLSDLLLGLGAQSVVVQEHRPPGAEEQKIFSDGTATPLWDQCDILVHFALEVGC